MKDRSEAQITTGMGGGGGGEGQSCKTEHLTCGIRCSLAADDVRTEMSSETLSWCVKIAWCHVGDPHFHPTHARLIAELNLSFPSGHLVQSLGNFTSSAVV